MAQTLSALVQNSFGDPTIANSAKVTPTIPKLFRDSVTVPDTANDDTVILGPIPSDAVIDTLEVVAADSGTTGIVNIGVYRPNYSGNTVTFEALDDACIASALDFSTPVANALAPQRFNGLNADSYDKKLWEIAGLTARPSIPLLYIGIKTTTGTTVAGTMTISCTYTA